MRRRPSASFMCNSPLTRPGESLSTWLVIGASRGSCCPTHLDIGSGLGEFEKDNGSSIEECLDLRQGGFLPPLACLDLL